MDANPLLDAVHADLDRRDERNPITEAQARQYVVAVEESERLTEVLRSLSPESTEAKRVATARDRASRTAATLARTLGLTAQARRSEPKPEGGDSLLDLLREMGMVP